MSEWIDLLLQPFAFSFMRQAFLISVLVAIPAALLSCFLVLKSWSLMGDAISHAVLPGLVLAYVAGFPVAVGAFAAGMFCAVATGFLSENSRIKEDTIMGIVFSGMFGLGVVLNTSIQTGVHLHQLLFGDMLGIVWRDVAETGAIAALVVIAIVLKWRDLLLNAFDSQHAKAIGLPIRWLHYGLLSLLAMSIVAGLKAVGIILVIAVLIAPGATAFLVTRRFGAMMMTAVAIAVFSSFFGVYLSFFIDSAPAPTIVLLMSVTFAVVFVATRRGAVASPDRRSLLQAQKNPGAAKPRDLF